MRCGRVGHTARRSSRDRIAERRQNLRLRLLNSSFALASTNTNPQGIADPPEPTAGRPITPHTSTSADSSFDSALLSIVGELDGFLTGGKKRR